MYQGLRIPTTWPFFPGLGHSGSVPDFGAESFACGMCYGPLLPGLWEGMILSGMG